MPIYETNEHEMLKESATAIQDSEEITDGILYLTDKRLIYERKGKRTFLRASPSHVIADIRLFSITNISVAVPKFKLLTKKTLSIEYRDKDQTYKINFVVGNPKEWDENIRKWIGDAKRGREEEIKREREDAYKREIELAKAKSPKANVGMAYFGTKGGKEEGNYPVVETKYTEESESDLPMPQETFCPNCNSPVSSGMKFCPQCGKQL